MEMFACHSNGVGDKVAFCVAEDETVKTLKEKVAKVLGLRDGSEFEVAIDNQPVTHDEELTSRVSLGADVQASNVRHPSWKEGIVPDDDVLVDMQETCYTDGIAFPTPTGLSVQMMPFINASTFADTRLPESLREYWETFFPLILEQLDSDDGTICFITVDEREVEVGETQRRPGLHTECPGVLQVDGHDKLGARKGEGTHWVRDLGWGSSEGRMDGGIIFASNMADTCAVWPCRIAATERSGPLTRAGGDLEHLRQYMPVEPTLLLADNLYWMTDQTPHEALPANLSGVRQFFRVVTSKVSYWFAEHSTPNPNGVVPDPVITTVLTGNKFRGELRVAEPA